MSFLRFNHVYAMLLVLSGLCAFVIPASALDPLRPGVQKLFTPVAWPVRVVTSRLDMVWTAREVDPRSAAAMAEENQQLRMELASLTLQLDKLKELNDDRARLGDVRRLCVPVAVVGGDAGARQSLAFGGSSLQGMKRGMSVVYSGGLVGQVNRVGVAGGQVRLITDRGVREEGEFCRFATDKNGQTVLLRVPKIKPLVEGLGRGEMAVLHLELKQVKELVRVDDWVILNDSQWPTVLQGFKIGKVVSIAPRGDAPLFADIRIRPAVELMKLREVMVVVRE